MTIAAATLAVGSTISIPARAMSDIEAKPIAECIIREIKANPSYTSKDGGISSGAVLQSCIHELVDFLPVCASGLGEKDCIAVALAFSQASMMAENR
jgi:hypothetical protein